MKINDFVPYYIVKKLEKIDFTGPAMGLYYEAGKKLYYGKGAFTSRKESKLAPLYCEVFKWFREKHGLHVNLNPVADCTEKGFTPNGKYSGTIDDVTIGKELFSTDTICLIPRCDSYEEAEEISLIKLIDLVKKKIKNHE